MSLSLPKDLYGVTASQTIWIPPTTSYSGMPMEFNFYGLHRETPFLFRL